MPIGRRLITCPTWPQAHGDRSDCFEGGIAWIVIQQAAGLFYAAVGGAGDVVPGGCGFLFGDGLAPGFPREKTDSGFAAVPAGYGFGIANHGHGFRRYYVEAFAHGVRSVFDGFCEGLRHIVRMHVVKSFAAEVGQGDFVALL